MKKSSETKPYPYQLIGEKKIHHKFNGRALLADDMGLGKSFQALLYYKKRLKGKKLLIICPSTLKWNWQNEIKKHIKMDSAVLERMHPHAKEKENLKLSKIFIINYEILGDVNDKKSWANFLRKQKIDLLVMDECHNIKNPDAKRSKNCKKMAKRIKGIICISGTPITNRPTEVWTCLNILHPDLFPSYKNFASRYSYPSWSHWGVQYKGARRLKELHKVLRSVCMIRRLKKNVLKQLPPKTRTVIPIHLPAKLMAEYKNAEDNFRAWLSKTHPKRAKKKMKAEAIIKLGYLKRLASYLKLEYIKEWLNEFLQDTDEKIIVAGIHKFMIRHLNVDVYPDMSVRIDGSIKGAKRQEAINRFNDNKNIRIMFANIKSGGVGWNGVSASTVMFAEIDWVPALHVQMEDRTHRIGQKKHVQVYYLVAAGTIEEMLCNINQEKQITIDSALDGGRQTDTFDLFDQLIDKIGE